MAGAARRRDGHVGAARVVDGERGGATARQRHVRVAERARLARAPRAHASQAHARGAARQLAEGERRRARELGRRRRRAAEGHLESDSSARAPRLSAPHTHTHTRTRADAHTHARTRTLWRTCVSHRHCLCGAHRAPRRRRWRRRRPPAAAAARAGRHPPAAAPAETGASRATTTPERGWLRARRPGAGSTWRARRAPSAPHCPPRRRPRSARARVNVREHSPACVPVRVCVKLGSDVFACACVCSGADAGTRTSSSSSLSLLLATPPLLSFAPRLRVYTAAVTRGGARVPRAAAPRGRQPSTSSSARTLTRTDAAPADSGEPGAEWGERSGLGMYS